MFPRIIEGFSPVTRTYVRRSHAAPIGPSLWDVLLSRWTYRLVLLLQNMEWVYVSAHLEMNVLRVDIIGRSGVVTPYILTIFTDENETSIRQRAETERKRLDEMEQRKTQP